MQPLAHTLVCTHSPFVPPKLKRRTLRPFCIFFLVLPPSQCHHYHTTLAPASPIIKTSSAALCRVAHCHLLPFACLLPFIPHPIWIAFLCKPPGVSTLPAWGELQQSREHWLAGPPFNAQALSSTGSSCACRSPLCWCPNSEPVYTWAAEGKSPHTQTATVGSLTYQVGCEEGKGCRHTAAREEMRVARPHFSLTVGQEEREECCTPAHARTSAAAVGTLAAGGRG